MPRGKSIDLDAIHSRLYEETDSQGLIRVAQNKLAAEMELVPETICRALKKMEIQGRLKRISSRKNNIGVYLIVSPNDWKIRQKAIIPDS